MAKKKSVSISVKPAHVPAVTAGGTSAMTGDVIPLTAPASGDAAALGADCGMGLIARTVYGAVYALSFGCVFGALMVVRIVPGRDLLAKGICDGARAARQTAGWLPGSVEKAGEAGLRA
ncbi:MAG: hypothetical protein MUF20_07965 [Methylotetracoccus sp.]|jgi:hypothetical protein|nr:hypothetical protein [Methylotetracoccus sp.]